MNMNAADCFFFITLCGLTISHISSFQYNLIKCFFFLSLPLSCFSVYLQEYCVRLGGHLASIHNSNEARFVGGWLGWYQSQNRHLRSLIGVFLSFIALSSPWSVHHNPLYLSLYLSISLSLSVPPLCISPCFSECRPNSHTYFRLEIRI